MRCQSLVKYESIIDQFAHILRFTRTYSAIFVSVKVMMAV